MVSSINNKTNFLKIILIILILLISNLIIYTESINAQSAYGDQIVTPDYKISRSIINRTIAKGSVLMDKIEIENLGALSKKVSYIASGQVAEIISFDTTGTVLEPNKKSSIYFRIIGENVGNFSGEIVFSSDIDLKIPVGIEIVDKIHENPFLVKIESVRDKFTLEESLEVIVIIDRLSNKKIENVSFTYTIQKIDEQIETILLSPGMKEIPSVMLMPEPEIKEVEGSFQIRKKFDIPEGLTEGNYIINVILDYEGELYGSSTTIRLIIPFIQIKIFGIIPVWAVILSGGIILVLFVAGVVIRKEIMRRKKYKMEVYLKTLAKKGDRALWLGNVAEKNVKAYYDMDKLTTHAVVAGATGGGKSIAAQVLIE
ncbi:MAG: DUF87 domain-containing protein, partial [Nanoarchaeota archaeon]